MFASAHYIIHSKEGTIRKKSQRDLDPGEDKSLSKALLLLYVGRSGFGCYTMLTAPIGTVGITHKETPYNAAPLFTQGTRIRDSPYQICRLSTLLLFLIF